MRGQRLAVVVFLTGLALSAPLVAPRVAQATSGSQCATPFTESFRRDLSRQFPWRVTAAVYDTRTRCWYHLNPGMRITTASVIKAQMLGVNLLKAQEGRRGLTAWERSKIAPMMRYSHDQPSSALYGHIGGAAAMAAYDRRVGITATTHTSRYGATSSTAADRTKVSLGLLYGGGPLGPPARREAWRYMGDVHPTQQWGITAGLRLGWSAALKNGFYPGTGGRWRVGSTGFVRQDASGEGYAVTVMSTGVPDQDAGIALVETVARQVANTLSAGRPARRRVDRSRCTTPRPGEAWAAVAARLGAGSRAGDVQRVSGGGPRPLRGQRVCADRLFTRGWR